MSVIDRQLIPPETREPSSSLVQALIERELAPNERVTWSDQPLPGRMAMNSVPMVIFGIPWTLFSMFWVAMAFAGTMKEVQSGQWLALAFPLFGVQFILIGFGMLSAPYGAVPGGAAERLRDHQSAGDHLSERLPRQYHRSVI